jgi:mono/diheme cytochrome c family protein
MKKLRLFSAGLFLFASAMFISNTALAQKPAGKPWPTPDAAAAKKNPVKAGDADAIKEGKDLYIQHCKSCHGAKGKGDGSKAEKIDISCNDFTTAEYKKKTDGENYYKTTEGRKPMPSYKEKMSDSERWKVVAYMRTL